MLSIIQNTSNISLVILFDSKALHEAALSHEECGNGSRCGLCYHRSNLIIQEFIKEKNDSNNN